MKVSILIYGQQPIASGELIEYHWPTVLTQFVYVLTKGACVSQ